jgi:hypothetical protein
MYLSRAAGFGLLIKTSNAGLWLQSNSVLARPRGWSLRSPQPGKDSSVLAASGYRSHFRSRRIAPSQSEPGSFGATTMTH